MRYAVRSLAALFSLWFAMVLGDPGVLHSCAMHGSHGGHATATSSAVTSGHDMHASHGAHDVAHAPAPSNGRQPAKTPAPCTCIGHCCAVTIAAPLTAPATLVVPVAVAEQRRPLDASSCDALPAAPDRRLPFANGPPTV
jgi:hypothetical protein